MATMVEVVALSNGCVEHPKTRRDTLSGTVPPSPPTNLAVLLNVPTKTVAQPTSPTRPLTVSATRETHESRGENGRLGLDVAVIPSKRERLKRLTFASKLEKVADRNAKFEQCDEERLAAFEQYLANNDRRLFQGFPANRRLGVSLVSISGRSDSTPVTYICIQGLQNEREIVRCHAILSQKLVRDEYKPLRLCYDKSQIRAAAADDDDYCADVDPDGMTLCGTLIRQGGAGEASHLSTIGGVLQIDGSLYAVTTSHSSQEEEESADPLDGSTEQGSASATDVELDVDEDALDDDTEPPLVVDEWRAEEWRETYDTPLAKSPLSAAQYGKHPDRSWPNMGKVFKDGTDWRLISIDDKLLWRPNVLSPVPREGEGVPDHIYLNHFDTQPHRNPSERRFWILGD
ncbi:MAG: hypothetical protein M1815_005048 [Lichina confinis]|nr:MAG: hypothetical protein M1815_005048 [Lichina confinis]